MMKKHVILLLSVFFCSCHIISAVNYYVSASLGNDLNSGKSVSDAWKSLSKLNDYSFAPGDTVFFMRGDTWRETLVIPSSGNKDKYIVFSAWGKGPDPRILGSEQILSWTETAPGSNVWKSATTFGSNPYSGREPSEIFFEGYNGEKEWGKYSSDISGLRQDLQWTYVSENIYIYSDADPGTVYKSVEVPLRESGVNMNRQNYIKFDSIDILYTKWSGYGYDWTHNDMRQQFGLVIENSEIGFIGAWDPELENGYGIEVVYSDMVVRNNRIHDCGRRGFAMDMYGNGFTAKNILVEENEFFNGFHTTGLDIDVGAGYNASLDNITIRSNFFFETSLTRTNDYSNLIFIQNNNTSSCSITNLFIYNNIFKYANGYGILMENVQSVYIYNNVFYDKNPRAGWASLVSVQGSSRATVKNNIFYKSWDSGGSGELETNNYTTHDYNLYFNTTVPGREQHGVFSTDPLFDDAGSNNFHLQEGSPAIGKGIRIILDYGSSPVPLEKDYDGKYYNDPPSIGAFEGNPLNKPASGVGQKMIVLYPNPSAGYLTIQRDSTILSRQDIRIINLAGKLVYYSTFEQGAIKKTIPVTLSPGIYVVRLSADNLNVSEQKLIVIR